MRCAARVTSAARGCACSQTADGDAATHVEGEVDPARDVRTVARELVAHDANVVSFAMQGGRENQDATSIPLGALKRVATDSEVAYVVEGVSISSNGSGSR